MMAMVPIRANAQDSNTVGIDIGEHEQEQDQDFQQDDFNKRD